MTIDRSHERLVEVITPSHSAKPYAEAMANTWEYLAVLGYLIVFVVVATLVVAHGRPHADAVMDAEVAVNSVTGKGPVSFAHPQVPPGMPLPDISPIYSRALTAWLWAFGLSSQSVMSMNVVVIAATTFILWLFLARTSLLCHSWSRLMFVACLPLISPVAIIYRINRYDSFGMLGLASACAALTIHRRSARLLILSCAGVLIGTAGFHVVIGGGLLTLLALGTLGRRYLGEFLAVNTGVAIGLAYTLAAIVTSGAVVATQRALEQNGVVAHRPLSWHLLAPLRGGQLTRLVDADLLLLGSLCVAALGFTRGYHGPRAAKASLLFGLVAAMLIPLTLSGFGRYSDTYVWLTAIPVFTCCLIALDHNSRLRVWAASIAALLLCTAFVGFPAHALILATEWRAQDRSVADAFISRHSQPDDVAYACVVGYYAAKRDTKTAYVGSAFHSMTKPQQAGVTLLILDGHENGKAMYEPSADEAIEAFGGNWEMVGEFISPRGDLRKKIPPAPKSNCTYHVLIYRKMPVGALSHD